MNIEPYIRMARPSHWFKNVFMVPGLLLALYFDPQLVAWSSVLRFLAGLLAASIVASSNYVLNEILDASQDQHHPEKKTRALASRRANKASAYGFWVVLSLAGISAGFVLGPMFGWCCLALWIMAILYNVRPVRLKDMPYLDVLSESINNPLRLAMGWYVTVSIAAPPPLSIIMAYWMFGAYLMVIKRFAEYRHIQDPGTAARYRKSFSYYNEEKLLESTVFYATFFAMMSGVFIVRYCRDLLLATPAVTYCMAYYLHLGFKPDSPVQHPERLLQHRKLALIVLLTCAICTLFLFLDIPGFGDSFDPLIEPQR